MKIPATEECIALLKKYETFDNILAHVNAVNRVAVFLAKKMKKNGINVDVELVNAASLLHDIGKSEEIRRKERKEKFIDHRDLGRDMLAKEGYPEIGEIIYKHALENILTPNRPKTWEEKLVYYADKRAEHDKIVPLKQRLEYIRKRYAMRVEDKMDEIIPAALALEKEILSAAKVGEDLEGLK